MKLINLKSENISIKVLQCIKQEEVVHISNLRLHFIPEKLRKNMEKKIETNSGRKEIFKVKG